MRTCGPRTNAISGLTAIAILLLTATAPADQPKRGPLKVFILVGQSNMEGQGKIACDLTKNGGQGSLDYVAHHPATANGFKGVLGKDGKWIVRDDVWIWYLGRKGKLTVGYGAKEGLIGTAMGDAMKKLCGK